MLRMLYCSLVGLPNCSADERDMRWELGRTGLTAKASTKRKTTGREAEGEGGGKLGGKQVCLCCLDL